MGGVDGGVENGNGGDDGIAARADEADGDGSVIIDFSDKPRIGAGGICVNADAASCSSGGPLAAIPMDEAVSTKVEQLACMVLGATKWTMSASAV